MCAGSGATQARSASTCGEDGLDSGIAVALSAGMQPSTSHSLVMLTLLAFTSIAHAQLPPELAGLDTQSRGPSQAGSRDCDKADAEQKAHFEKNMDDPQAAVLGGAKLGCTYLQRVAWKPPTAKKAPASKASKGAPSAADVARRAADFWAGADDVDYVKVLSGGVLGTWQKLEMSDAPGVPSARTINVFHVIVAALADNTQGCFVLYGHLEQRNGNHPDRTLPPAWSASEYKASDFQRAQKIACPKGAKAPKPPQ